MCTEEIFLGEATNEVQLMRWVDNTLLIVHTFTLVVQSRCLEISEVIQPEVPHATKQGFVVGMHVFPYDNSLLWQKTPLRFGLKHF